MNRNKLIDLFISNLANAVVHKILEKVIDVPEIASRYVKEIRDSWQIALEYRKKINPVNFPLPEQDIGEIKTKIMNKVKSELKLRIEKGYKNIDLNSVEEIVEQTLKEIGVI